MLAEFKDQKEKLFEGLKIYYSGSIKGAPEPDPNFAWNLVQYMIQNGANVLSEHVAARNMDEMDEIKAGKMGITVTELRSIPREIYLKDVIRKQDLKWVDEATHVVSLVNSAGSYGVGMELQEAILKPRLGLNPTPVLCLIHESLYGNLSGMVTGAEDSGSEFYIKSYKDLEDAKTTIRIFLTGKFKL
jgi:hypothetical protein